MPKPKVSLYLRFRLPDGKQSPCRPALYDSKSRIRPFWCLVKGTPERHAEATYYKRVKREGKWGGESVGNDANAAFSRSQCRGRDHSSKVKAGHADSEGRLPHR
jgi:hypothetical protein